MKTKIRIQTGVSSALGANYLHYVIDILVERFKGSRYLEPAGQITFQANHNDPNNWYGIHYSCDTDKSRYIEKMASIAKFISTNKSGYDAQPDEIIKLIGGQEHIFFDGEFIPKSDNGKKIFRVIKQGSLYEKITAVDETQAKKLLSKKKIEGATLKFHCDISF